MAAGALSRQCGGRNAERNDGKGRQESALGLAGRDFGDRRGNVEAPRAVGKQRRIADHIERRHGLRGAPRPRRQRDVGADPGGFAQRDRQNA